MKRPTVMPQLPLHIQNKGSALQGERGKGQSVQSVWSDTNQHEIKKSNPNW